MYTNIFHLVSTGKLATQWFKKMFDEIAKMNPPIKIIKWVDVKVNGEFPFLGARTLNPMVIKLQPNTLYHNVNYDYKSFKEKIILVDDNYIGFYVYREPREYIMSTYYSWMFSHPGGHEKRNFIKSLNKEEGLKYIIDQTKEWNEWDMIRSWGLCDDNKIIKLKFEEIFGTDEKQNRMIELFNEKMGLSLSNKQLTTLKNNMKYSNFSGGRKQGEKNNKHHYRSGGELTWKNEMSDNVLSHFYKVTGDLVEILGYEK